jgi:plastocyanin
MLTRVSVACGLVLAVLGSHSPSVQAADWGSIEGQFVLDGKAEPVPAMPLPAAAAACGVPSIADDSLLVNPANNGIANIFVYLNKAPADIHPDLKAVPTAKQKSDQKSCVFLPHALTLRVGETVNCINSDATSHNLHTNPVAGTAANNIITANDQVGQDLKFAIAETLPVTVNCDVHSFMKCYWLVKDHPYVAVTDADGKFKIENLPVGEHTFRVWQERVGYVNREYKVKVVAGKNPTLEVVKIPAAKLAKK